MSRRIFFDVEEAISREVRRITFNNERTVSETVLQDLYDPFTGELISAPIQPNFYDSSADANHIQYPSIFVKFLKSREDRFTGRVIPEYGKQIILPIPTAPAAYNIVATDSDGTVVPGNTLQTNLFTIRKVQPNYLLRLLSGNNKGTYIISTVTPSNVGEHTITVSNILLNNLPSSHFDSITGNLYFSQTIDLNTIKVGDTFVDHSNHSFVISAITLNKLIITIPPSSTPDLTAGGKITRSGNVFQNSEIGLVSYTVMDPSQPVIKDFADGADQANAALTGVSPSIPLDAWYLARIDSKERAEHIQILNRVWEEFNPPRTALPTVVRSQASAEQLLTVDITTGGSTTVVVKDNSLFNINDEVFVFDDFVPTKSPDGAFFLPFSSKVIGKASTNQIILANTVPDTYIVANNAKIVSNAEYRLHMFHFVDHNTRDVEGSQYWVHEFTFMVQIWVDRQGDITDFDSVVQKIAPTIEDLNDGMVISQE